MRPETLGPLTFGEHQELSLELANAFSKLSELLAIVTEIYGPNNQAAFTFVKTVESLERLRHDMRAQAGQDCPGHETAHLYQ